MSRCDELEYTLDWPVGCELQIHHTSFCPSGQKGAENLSGLPNNVTKGNAGVNKTCVPWSESKICMFQILQNTRGSTTPWSLTDFPLDYSTRGATLCGRRWLRNLETFFTIFPLNLAPSAEMVQSLRRIPRGLIRPRGIPS